MSININATGLSEAQQLAVVQVSGLLGCQLDEGGLAVHFRRSGEGISISFDGQLGIIAYGEPHHFIRAFGLFIEKLKSGGKFQLCETPNYDSLGVMVDCSRNGVLHGDAYQKLIKMLALMGYSTVQLYTEDTYEIPGHPYFGYLRGRYTGEELSEMDRYAALFGIELVPCIQTLAHLSAALRWKANSHLIDCQDILLIDDPATYELIDRMFEAMARNLSSRKINIGMDEAHMMGLGKYLDKHGYTDRSTLMLKHFNRVMEIARKYGYRPMMWSDMFFRLASGGEYYNADSPIRQDVIDMMPDDIKLVYWDYYSETREKYDGMMRKHKQLSENIVFAGGAWKWMGFAPNNQFSHHIGLLAHESCKANQIKEVLITAWGDNGAEASQFSILPSLQFWAELCYTGGAVEEALRERFATCTGGVYSDFMGLDAANLVPDNQAPGVCSVNPSKYLLYQDIMYGLFDCHVIPEAYAHHYRRSAEMLAEATERNPSWGAIFAAQTALCRVLALKCDAGINIRHAYRTQDREALMRYSQEVLPELLERIRQFMEAYRKQWGSENKIYGLDVFDLRTGGLLQRVETAIRRIRDYVSGEIKWLEELEQDILPFDVMNTEAKNSHAISANLWHRIATPCVIEGI
ncbi:family 20 glycosylhydrolase [Paenibacillus oryzisoli]|uniref:beta-N-acetylhexosaminidase n=1 Tax=Paenibacillus oryzisoli TaxID=1850517 RepID=UPI003D27E899